MRLFFDLRLGYLVAAPGQSAALSAIGGKSGDGQPVEIQFGRSSDPVGGGSFFEGSQWEPEQLPGGTIVKIGIKLAGEFSDGDFLASTSTFTYDSERESYLGSLNLNTEEIDDALSRGDSDPEDDVPDVLCGFELTYQPGGSGPWRSSQEPVSYLLRHDIIYGDEATPVSAADPDEYLLKAQGIVWLSEIAALVGGDPSDLDAVPTVNLPVGTLVAMVDEDATPKTFRLYRLTSGDDETDAPGIVQPEDFEETTNEKIWIQETISGAAGIENPMTTAGDIIVGGTSGAPGRLGIGSEGEVLKVLSGTPSWGDAGMSNPMTTAGDIIVGGTSGAPGRLALGTSNQQLRVNSGGTALEYFTPAGGGGGSPNGKVTFSGSLQSSDYGKIVEFSPTMASEIGTLGTESAGTMIWVYTAQDTYAVTIEASSIYLNGSTVSDFRLDQAPYKDKIVALWTSGSNNWFVLATS